MLDWLELQPGDSWQGRWLASGADAEGNIAWRRLPTAVRAATGRGRADTEHGRLALARGVSLLVAGDVRRRGAKKAVVAVGRSVLIIIWHLLSDPHQVNDLGPDFYDRRVSASREMRNHVTQLEALGYKVTLEPAA